MIACTTGDPDPIYKLQINRINNGGCNSESGYDANLELTPLCMAIQNNIQHTCSDILFSEQHLQSRTLAVHS